MNFDSKAFRNAMGGFATGVSIVTVSDGEEVHAMTANSLTSVSLTPPVLLICVDHRAKCLHMIQQSGYFAVNILSEAQVEISKLFANQKVEKEPEFSFRYSELGGAPLLNNALVNLNCKVVEEVEIGDHTVFFGEAIDLQTNEGKPLCFFKGQYTKLA